MACSLAEIQAAACSSGIGKEQSQVKLLQLIAQLTCEAGQSAGAGVPSGVILMWSGSIASIPSGWLLCNGSSGTPDLRNRFVVCAQQDDAGSAKTNLTGSLTVSGGSISHTHSITDPGHYHGATAAPDALAYGSDVTHYVGEESPTTVEVTNISINSQSAPQPYYALAYIMKS